MGKYMYYLSSTLVKKKGIWITALIGMVGVFFMTYLQIKNANENQVAKINNWATFDFFLPFIFGSLMTTFFVIHAFKSGEHDGTELLVVAKPLTRTQIIFGKFSVVMIAQVLYHIILLPLYGALGIIDDVATNSEKIKFMLSFVIGGLIVQIFMIGLVTIFASLVGRIGTIVISILFASIIPIASFIITAVTGAFEAARGGDHNSYNIIKNLDVDELKKIEKVNLIYSEDSIKRFEKIDKDNKYKKIAYLDPWYQWSRFYTMMIDKSPQAKSGVIQYYEKSSLGLNPSDFKLKVHMKDKDGNDIYFVPYKKVYSHVGSRQKSISDRVKESKKLSDSDIQAIVADFYSDLNKGNLTKRKIEYPHADNKDEFKKLTFYEKITLVKNYVVNKRSMSLNGVLTNPSYNNYPRISELNSLRIMNKLVDKDPDLMHITSSKKNKNENYGWKDEISITTISDLNKAVVTRAKDYISSSLVVIIWLSIGAALIGLSILLYFKRDFK